jgi:hypothetical protein
VNICLSAWISIGLAIGSALVQAFILRSLVVRKLRSEFPIFFLYNCVGILVVAVCIPSYIFKFNYFSIFWTLNFIYMALEFGVMYEILVNALKPYSALIDLGKMLFRWAGLFLLLAGLLTALATSGVQASKMEAGVALVERSMRLMECGLLLLFFFFEKRLGLSWRNYNMSIALGMGASSALDLSFSYLKVHYASQYDTFVIIEGLFYVAVVSFWAASLAKPEPARKNVLDSPSRLIFQRWNEALVTYGHRGGELAMASSSVESFLPGVEQTVERILARKMVQ